MNMSIPAANLNKSRASSGQQALSRIYKPPDTRHRAKQMMQDSLASATYWIQRRFLKVVPQ